MYYLLGLFALTLNYRNLREVQIQKDYDGDDYDDEKFMGNKKNKNKNKMS